MARRDASRIIAHSESVGMPELERAVTVNAALAGAALLPLLVTKPFASTVLVSTPAVAEVTFTVTVQVPVVLVARVAAGMVPPAPKDKTPVPATAVTAPPQVVLAFGTAAITMPAGKLSVREVIVSGVSTLELDSVMVRTDVPPAAIVAGRKLLLTVGATAPRTRGALAHPPIVLPPTVIVTAPAAPVPASARPVRLPAPSVILASAMTVPLKEVPLSVAEEPTCQYTLQALPPAMRTLEPTLAVTVLAVVRKIQTSEAVPVSVSTPVIAKEPREQ